MSGLIDKAYDPRDGALMMKSMQNKWRESFPGTALDPAKWDVVVGAGMSVTVSGGVLTVNSGINASVETIITSKETFLIPYRMMAALMMSQRIANQEFYIELVSCSELNTVPDEQNLAAWRLQGITATSADYIVKNVSSPAPLVSPVAIPTSATYQVFELEPFADECWFHTRAIDSNAGRSASAVRHRDIPDPNARYKVRIRVKNLATAPASSTALTLLYAACTDYMELTTEITAGRGSIAAGQGLPVNVTSTLSTIPYLTPSISYGATAGATRLSDATTNAVLVKASAGAISHIFASNTTAAWKFVKFYNKATAPVVGTDAPLFVIGIPPNDTLTIPLVMQLRFSLGIGFAITGGAATTDVTATAAGDVLLNFAWI